MSPTKRGGEPAGTPWWLEPGPEICPFCDAAFSFEAAVYCAACDQRICALCFVEIRETRTVLCPSCDRHGET